MVLGICLLSVSGVAQERLALEELAPGVFVALSPPGHAGAANAGFLVYPDEVVVIDTHMVPAAARELLERIREHTAAPVRYVVNTHWHPDHTQGSGIYASEFGADTLFVSHTTTRTDIGTLGQARLERDRASQPALTNVELVLPNLTFARALELHLTARRIQLLYFGRGHTRGDVVVYLPDDRIAFVGDLVTGGPPFARDGYPFAWIDTLRALDRIEIDTVVGGHGKVWRSKQVISDRIRFLEQATATLRRGAARGDSAEAIASVLDLERFRDTFEPEPPSAPWRGWMHMIAERGLEELRDMESSER